LLRGHVVDGGALLCGAELAVEPCDLNVEQLAPELRGLLALGAPCCLQSGVRESCLQRLLGAAHFGGHGAAHERIEPEAAKHRRRAGRSADLPNEIPPCSRRHDRVHCHCILPNGRCGKSTELHLHPLCAIRTTGTLVSVPCWRLAHSLTANLQPNKTR